jgi:hypothetical protein
LAQTVQAHGFRAHYLLNHVGHVDAGKARHSHSVRKHENNPPVNYIFFSIFEKIFVISA